ncbi:MAG TPA: anti-sigma factor [Thermoanaerobaculia bacterium]|nr:anti-sigma factor [Thermoanaerobaculia bacterium]
MSEETLREDQAILDALEAPDGGLSVRSRTARDETEDTLARLYTEVLGLIPCELEPVAPRPEVKQRLMAAIAGAPQAQAAPASPERPAVASTPTPAPKPYAPPPPVRRARRWPLALAASLALVFAGLLGVLAPVLFEQQREIAALRQERDVFRKGLDQAKQQEAQVSGDMDRMRQGMKIVTSPALLAAPLRPSGASPQPNARGTMFVAADHQHWYLTAHGLEPSSPGQSYQLWFVAGPQTVSGGTFTARPGEPVTLSSESMPEGTTAAVVTVEDADGSAQPTGPEVLRAAQMYEL